MVAVISDELGPTEAVLPETQQERIRQIRRRMLEGIQKATRKHARFLKRDTDEAIRKIIRSNYDPQVVRREVRSYVSGDYKRLRTALAAQIEEAALLAQRTDELIRYYGIAERLRHHGLLDPQGRPELIQGYQYRFLTGKGGEAAAESAVAREVLAARNRRSPGWTPRTEGDRLIKQSDKIRPWRQVRKTSRKLHGDEIATRMDVTRQAVSAAREARGMDQASRELIRELEKRGQRFAQNERIPKLVDELEQAASKLVARADDPAVKREWRATRRKIRKYLRTLKEHGRVQGAWVELLQDTHRKGPQYFEKAAEKFMYWKRRYSAERLLDHETQTAYRARQALHAERRDWVVGGYWRLNRGFHARWVARLKRNRGSSRARPQGRGGRRRRGRRRGRVNCICEHLADHRFSKEAMLEYPNMGHPHCSCWWELIIDRARMLAAPLRRDELDWYRSTGGQLHLEL